SSVDPDSAGSNEARLAPELLDELAALPGVAAIDTGAFAVLGNEAGGLIGVQGYSRVWDDVEVAAGRFDLDELADGRVAIGPSLARSEGLRPGDEVTLVTPDGEVSLPIMAVLYDGSFGGRNVQMDLGL